MVSASKSLTLLRTTAPARESDKKRGRKEFDDDDGGAGFRNNDAGEQK